jgi:hypothetical protein
MITKFVRTYECFFGAESTMTTGYGDVWLNLHSEPEKAPDEESDPVFPNTASVPHLRSWGGLPSRIIPPGRVGWRPSFITFHKFNNIVYEGQEFVLIPRLWRSEAYGTGHANVSYETSATWQRWDDAINGFRGRIPPSSEASIGPAYYSSASNSRSPGMATMRIIVSAIANESFALTVRLEKKFRTRISLKVLPNQALITTKACVLGLPSRAGVLPDTRSDHARLRHERVDAEWVQQKLSSLADFGSMEGTAESCPRGYLTPPQEQPHSSAMNTTDDICETPNDISMAMSTTDAIRETLEELPPLPGIDLRLLIETRKQLLRQKRLAEKPLGLSEDSFDYCPSPDPSSVPGSEDDNEAVDVAEGCDERSCNELNIDEMWKSLRVRLLDMCSNESDREPEGENENGSLASLDMEKARESSHVLLHDWSFDQDCCDAEFEEEQESHRVLLYDWSFDKDCLDSESEEEDDPEGTFERGCIEFEDEQEHETPDVVYNWFDKSCDDLHAAKRGERQTPSDGQEALLEKRKDKSRRFSELLRAIQARDFWGSWEEDARREDGSESEYSLWAGSLDLA